LIEREGWEREDAFAHFDDTARIQLSINET